MEHNELRKERKRTKILHFPVRDSTVKCLCCFVTAIGLTALVDLLSVTRVWMRKITFFMLQALIFSNIQGIFGTADKYFLRKDN